MNIPDNTIHMLMEQAQVFASCWAIAGSRLDQGDGHERAEEEKQVLRRMIENALTTPPVQQCRDDGRCQYAIDCSAEGIGHCPPGKCAMPVQQDDEALEVLRRIISTWESPWPPGADPMAHVLAEARALLTKRGAA